MRWGRWILGGALAAAAGAASWLTYRKMFAMPGRSYQGPLPPPDDEQHAVAQELREIVRRLATDIGERHLHGRYQQLDRAAYFLAGRLTDLGYDVEHQDFMVRNVHVENVIAEVRGTRSPQEIIVVGAHYDSVVDCPGANDNGSGCAGVLSLARYFADHKPDRTIRFVLFVNEEPPFFQTEEMGSYVYARRCHDLGEDVRAMLALETIGYYSDEPGSQSYPASSTRACPTPATSSPSSGISSLPGWSNNASTRSDAAAASLPRVPRCPGT